MKKELTMRRLTATLAVSGALLSGIAHAQFGRGAGEWNTAGGDAHRSFWTPTDGKISRASLAKPGFAMTWKVKLDNAPRASNALTPSLIMTGYIGYRGFRSLGFLSGSSDKIYGVEIDVGRVEWQKFEGWSYFKKGPKVGEKRDFYAAYQPLPSVPIQSLDFTPLGLPEIDRLGLVDYDDTASIADAEEDDD